MRRSPLALPLLAAVTVSAALASAPPTDPLAPGTRVWLDAHNCYPEQGRYADRLPRALSSTSGPVAIEQDLLWHVDGATGAGRVLVTHGGPVRGDEPTLEEHFFKSMQPRLEAARREGRASTWPRYVLHLDFKSNEPALHDAVWDLLGRYDRYLTTAARAADGARVLPLALGPLLVLTEQGPGQEDRFHDRVPVGHRLRLFGTVPTPNLAPDASPAQRARAVRQATPAVLMPTAATNYRRWANFPWAVVEEGGPPAAGTWTLQDEERLHRLAQHAHARGLWLRFYTLNGHAPVDHDEWSAGYNFGDLAAARARWRAAIGAGVEFIATDQYDLIAAELSMRR